MNINKDECIFCQIILGKSPVSIVYEDEKVIVFPPLRPVNKGHLLIVPKHHVSELSDLEDELSMYTIKIAKKISKAIRKSIYPSEGINLFLADGEAAGQEVFHYHLHVYPRYNGDNFGFKYDLSKHFVYQKREELDRVANEIKKHLL